MYKRILLPTDGGEGVDSAIEHALELAGTYEAELHVLHVVDDASLDSVSEDAMTDLRQRGDDAVADVAERAAEEGIETETAVREGSPHREILDYTDAAAIDLVVMGTHGRSGVGRVLMGSVTERVVRAASVPVVTVRVGAGDGGDVRTPAAAERRARRALEGAGHEEIRFPDDPYRTSSAWVVPARTATGTFNVHVDAGEGSTRLARLDD
jgi:nucleotide-binding universal stress UspA family protein